MVVAMTEMYKYIKNTVLFNNQESTVNIATIRAQFKFLLFYHLIFWYDNDVSGA